MTDSLFALLYTKPLLKCIYPREKTLFVALLWEPSLLFKSRPHFGMEAQFSSIELAFPENVSKLPLIPLARHISYDTFFVSTNVCFYYKHK